MKESEIVKNEIIKRLQNLKDCEDLTDIGNEIGIAIGVHLGKDIIKDDFIIGLNHGISLVDGTH